MTQRMVFNRRQFLHATTATAALGAFGAGRAAAASAATIGFIYVGPKDDYGYNQAHAEGAAALKKAMHGVDD
jgi:simple sugar transport system substrate-binding protein